MTPAANTLPLRDIHLPDPVSWWPPAPGWWLLLLIVLMIGAALAWLYRRYRRGALQRSAKQALQRIADDYRQHQDDRRTVIHLSGLLRRLSLSRYPREQVAGLTGQAWLNWLDRQLPGEPFQHGPGRALIEAPYARQSKIDTPELLALCGRWIQALPATEVRYRD